METGQKATGNWEAVQGLLRRAERVCAAVAAALDAGQSPTEGPHSQEGKMAPHSQGSAGAE